MKASVIIPSWNGARWIADCLRSILAQGGEDREVIVVDNGSTDGTPDRVAGDFPAVHLIRLPYNTGFAGAVNRGLQTAQGEVLVLINQDVVLRAGCLAALARRQQENGPAIVGCKLLYPDGLTVQHAGGIISHLRGEPDHRGYRQIDDGRWDAVAHVDYVTGAVFALHRAVLRAVGSFDEQFYPAYYEEVDYCFRARAAGFAVVYEPRAVAIHYESQSHNTGAVPYHQAMQRGRLRFVLKHYAQEHFAAFLAAEGAFVRGISPSFARQVMAGAYSHALLRLPDIGYPPRTAGGPAAASPWPDDLVREVAAGLAELYMLALHPPIVREDLMESQLLPMDFPAIREHDFRSRVAVLGPLISLARRAAYQAAARWGVAAVVEQQNRINQMAAGYLAELGRQLHVQSERLEEYDARLLEQDRDLAFLSRSLAELEIRQRRLLDTVGVRPGWEPEAATAGRAKQECE